VEATDGLTAPRWCALPPARRMPRVINRRAAGAASTPGPLACRGSLYAPHSPTVAEIQQHSKLSRRRRAPQPTDAPGLASRKL